MVGTVQAGADLLLKHLTTGCCQQGLLVRSQSREKSIHQSTSLTTPGPLWICAGLATTPTPPMARARGGMTRSGRCRLATLAWCADSWHRDPLTDAPRARSAMEGPDPAGASRPSLLPSTLFLGKFFASVWTMYPQVRLRLFCVASA